MNVLFEVDTSVLLFCINPFFIFRFHSLCFFLPLYSLIYYYIWLRHSLDSFETNNHLFYICLNKAICIVEWFMIKYVIDWLVSTIIVLWYLLTLTDKKYVLLLFVYFYAIQNLLHNKICLICDKRPLFSRV